MLLAVSLYRKLRSFAPLHVTQIVLHEKLIAAAIEITYSLPSSRSRYNHPWHYFVTTATDTASEACTPYVKQVYRYVYCIWLAEMAFCRNRHGLVTPVSHNRSICVSYGSPVATTSIVYFVIARNEKWTIELFSEIGLYHIPLMPGRTVDNISWFHEWSKAPGG